MPAYPADLPAPLLAGYGLTPLDQTLRTDMESGAARVRRRSRADNDRIDCAWLFSAAQFKTFRDWHKDGIAGIAGGSSWFDVSLDVGDNGMTPVLARFVGPWKSGREGSHWKIAAQLEVR